MVVKELIKRLSKLDPSLEVAVSSDEEGNSITLLSDITQESLETNGFGYGGTPRLEHSGGCDRKQYVVLWPA